MLVQKLNPTQTDTECEHCGGTANLLVLRRRDDGDVVGVVCADCRNLDATLTFETKGEPLPSDESIPF